MTKISPLVAIAALLTLAGSGSNAAAQDIFGFFRDLRPAPSYRTAPVQALAYGDPSAPAPAVPVPSAGYSRSVTYCVRLCDGRFFPMQIRASANAAQLCSAMCPASQTKTFSGSEINHSSAKDGTRYSALPNAFTFRTRMVDACTCNGKDSVGLATVDIKADTTLRPGDMVATADGKTTQAIAAKRATATASLR